MYYRGPTKATTINIINLTEREYSTLIRTCVHTTRVNVFPLFLTLSEDIRTWTAVTVYPISVQICAIGQGDCGCIETGDIQIAISTTILQQSVHESWKNPITSDNDD